MARLVLFSEDEEKTYQLEEKVTYIGRKSTCNIVIDDNSASRLHARIYNDNNDYLVVDTQSRNGTLVNGQKITQKYLSDRDHIKVGTANFKFYLDPQDKKPSFQLTKYEILEKIGRGGMGMVYKARQKSMDRIVALKILHERFARDKAFVERFIKEAQAAGKLSHPNIIHVHDVSKEKGQYYFSMEFVSGKTVMSEIIEQKAIPSPQGLEIVKQVAKALEFAHSNNLIHRDIKPDNIMVTDEKEVKLADLGIARNLQEANDELQKRTIYGTPLYMAPEQAMGQKVDHRLDIYSLGATFFHMVTGEPPFQGTTAIELLKKHINEPVPPPDDIVEDIPEDVCRVIEIMMAKDPEDRYQNAQELVDELEGIQKGRNVSSKRIFSETSILRKLSSGREMEPLINVVDGGAANDERVQELLSLDPKKRRSIIMIGLFLLSLIGIFLLTIYISDRVKDKTDNSSPKEDLVDLKELMEQLTPLQAAGDFDEELPVLTEILNRLSAADPRRTELEDRRAYLGGFLEQGDWADRSQKHIQKFEALDVLAASAAPDAAAIISMARECLDKEASRLFPERTARAKTLLEQFEAKQGARLREAETGLFNEIVSQDNTNPTGFRAVKSLAEEYLAKYPTLNAEHLKIVKEEQLAAFRGEQRIFETKRKEEIDMLREDVESAFENDQFGRVYELCSKLKGKPEFKDSAFSEQIDAILKEYRGKMRADLAGKLNQMQKDFGGNKYRKVTVDLEDMAKDFKDTEYLREIVSHQRKYMSGIDREYRKLLKKAEAKALVYEFTHARITVLKEITNFMGTPFQEKLERRSAEYEALDQLWNYLLTQGEKVKIELPERIIKIGKTNVLCGMKDVGVYVQIASGETIMPNFIKWENLENHQIYIIFRALLEDRQAPAAHYASLCTFCAHRGMKAELKDARELEQAAKKRQAEKTE